MIVNALISVFYVFYNCYAPFCIFKNSGKEIHKWDIKFSAFIDCVHEIDLTCGQTEEVAKSMIVISFSKIYLILWQNSLLDFDLLHITYSILLFSKIAHRVVEGSINYDVMMYIAHFNLHMLANVHSQI